MIYLARGLKSYKKHTWYAIDSVGILSLKLFHRNPFPFFLLHLLFPPPFIPFHLYQLRYYLPSGGYELLTDIPSCCDYQTITTLGKRRGRGEKSVGTPRGKC